MRENYMYQFMDLLGMRRGRIVFVETEVRESMISSYPLNLRRRTGAEVEHGCGIETVDLAPRVPAGKP